MDHSVAIAGLAASSDVFRVLDYARRILENGSDAPGIAECASILVGRDIADCSLRVSMRFRCGYEPVRRLAQHLSSLEPGRTVVLLTREVGIERFREGMLSGSRHLPPILNDAPLDANGHGCLDEGVARIDPAQLASLNASKCDAYLQLV